MKKRELFWIIVLLALLFAVVLVSGFFYFSFVFGNVGATGHVVLTSQDNLDLNSRGDSAVVEMKETPPGDFSGSDKSGK